MKKMFILGWCIASLILISACKKITPISQIAGAWSVDSYHYFHSTVPTMPPSDYFVEITPDSQIRFELEVNSCGSSFVMNERDIVFDEFSCTLAGGSDKYEDQINEIIFELVNGVMRGDRLILMSWSGRIKLSRV